MAHKVVKQSKASQYSSFTKPVASKSTPSLARRKSGLSSKAEEDLGSIEMAPAKTLEFTASQLRASMREKERQRRGRITSSLILLFGIIAILGMAFLFTAAYFKIDAVNIAGVLAVALASISPLLGQAITFHYFDQKRD